MNDLTVLLLATDRLQAEQMRANLPWPNYLVADLGHGIPGARRFADDDRSHAANALAAQAKTRHILYLRPGESLGGVWHPPDRPGRYFVEVYGGEVITKEARLFTEARPHFYNPVHEAADLKGCEPWDLPILSPGVNVEREGERLRKWAKDKPASPRPHYYLALWHLRHLELEAFFQEAAAFLVRESGTVAAGMLHYHCAQVYTALGLWERTEPHLVECLAAYPLMREFWEVAADACRRAGRHGAAAAFTANGRILGRQRPRFDLWPVRWRLYAG